MDAVSPCRERDVGPSIHKYFTVCPTCKRHTTSRKLEQQPVRQIFFSDLYEIHVCGNHTPKN